MYGVCRALIKALRQAVKGMQALLWIVCGNQSFVLL